MAKNRKRVLKIIYKCVENLITGKKGTSLSQWSVNKIYKK